MSRAGFATRPGAAERWVKARDGAALPVTTGFTARLTIDVTPAMRRQLKRAALEQNVSVADMLRALFAREFPLSGESHE